MGSPKGERLASGPENSCKRARPVGAPKGVQRVSCCRLALQQITVLRVLTFSRPFCSHFYLTNTRCFVPGLSGHSSCYDVFYHKDQQRSRIAFPNISQTVCAVSIPAEDPKIRFAGRREEPKRRLPEWEIVLLALGSPHQMERKTMDVTEDFHNRSIHSDAEKTGLRPSGDGKCSVVCFESESRSKKIILLS